MGKIGLLKECDVFHLCDNSTQEFLHIHHKSFMQYRQKKQKDKIAFEYLILCLQL
jgi:hypothetical protein